MTRFKRILLAVVGAALLLLGPACLNYAEAYKREHHAELAVEHGLPKPNESILWLGAVSIVAGSGLLGCLIGRAKWAP